MKIFLVGFMGSGKTSFGKKLAAFLGLDFVDLDRMIEENYQMTIPGIFSQFDETVFRKLESKVLQKYIHNNNFVLSCGGGTPCFNNNMDIINNNGISIYIRLNAKSLADRIANSKTKRPIIQNLKQEEMVVRIEEMLNLRNVYYEKAKITIEGLNLKVTDVVDTINDYANKTT